MLLLTKYLHACEEPGTVDGGVVSAVEKSKAGEGHRMW